MTRTTIWLCVAALLTAAPIWAQDRTDDAASSRYVGVVTGDRVNVRAGPETGYVITQLSAPTQVTVVGKVPGWLKILPPADAFGVISKQYVQPDATGKVGAVTGDSVFVRAGGPKRQVSFDALLVRLNKGDKVEIIGEVGTFYRIAPPAGSYFWISDQYVRSLTAGDTAAPAAPVAPAAPTERTLTPPDEPGGTVVPGTTERTAPPPAAPAETDTPASVAAQAAGVKEAEEAWKREMAKPHDQRDYTGMLQKYQAIELPAGHAMAPVVQAKLRYIQEMLRYQKETEEIARLVREARTTSERFDQARDEITVTTTTRPVTRYAAQGILAASDLFPGTGAVPKRWIVRDPQTLRVDAYVQATTQQVELKRYEGKLVGIHGKAVFDAALGLDIVEAERLVVLDESVKLPTPPKPILKVETPQPKLAPTPPVDVPGLGKPGDKPAAPAKLVPVEPAPVKPVPVIPAPAKLAPVEPAPVKPVPAKPTPAKLAPVEPAPAKPDPPRPDADKPIFPPEPAPAKPAPTTKPASSIVVPIPPPPPVDTRVIVIPPTTQPAPTTKPAPKTKPASAIINLPAPSGLPLE